MARKRGISPYWALLAVVILAAFAVIVLKAGGAAVVVQPTLANVGQTLSLRELFAEKEFVGSAGIRAGEWQDLGSGRYLYIDPDSFLKDDLRIKLEDVVLGSGGVGAENIPYANMRFYTSNIDESAARIISVQSNAGWSPLTGYYLPSDAHGLPYGVAHDPPILPDGNGIILTGKYIDEGRDCEQLVGKIAPTEDKAAYIQRCLNPTLPNIPTFTARANNVWNGYIFNIPKPSAILGQSAKIGLMFQIALDDRFADLGFLVNKTQVEEPATILNVTKDANGDVVVVITERNETTGTYEPVSSVIPTPAVEPTPSTGEVPAPSSTPTVQPIGYTQPSGGVSNELPPTPAEPQPIPAQPTNNAIWYIAGAIVAVAVVGGGYYYLSGKKRRRR